MARDFSKNTSNYLRLPANTINNLLSGAAAISMHVWANPDTIDTGANDNILIGIPITNIELSGVGLRINGSGANKVLRLVGRSQAADSSQSRDATSNIATGAWASLGGMFNITGDVMTPYVNGVAEGSGAVTFGAATYTPSTTDEGDYIGAFPLTGGVPTSTANQFDGRIAEVAMWTTDIGAAGFAMLAAGVSALLVRPESLVFYMPLVGYASPEIDVISARTGTITGTVAKAEHPRIFNPSSPLWFPPIASTSRISPYWYARNVHQ